MRDLVRSLGILAAMVGGVAAVTFGFAAALLPATAVAEPTPTPKPTFDLAVAPEVIGGRLQVTGDRTGTMTLDSASGLGGRYEREGDAVSIQPAEDVVLQGSDGRIKFQRDTGQIRLIDYDGLSFYLDPGQCTVTHGEVNDETGLMAALVDCPEIADVRGQGVIGVAGVVAVPAEVVRGRGDLPPSGGSVDVAVTGSVDVAVTSVTFDAAEIFLDGEPVEETGLIHWGIFTADRTSGIVLQYDPDADRFFLSDLVVLDESATLAEPCPIAAEELGRINEVTTVVRLDIDCTDVAVPGGGSGSVRGTLVADVIQGFTDVLPQP